MWNSLRSLRILSVTASATKVGDVKMNWSSSTCSSSAFKASKAYIEKHEAATFRRAPGFSACLRWSPSRRLMLSMSSIAGYSGSCATRRIGTNNRPGWACRVRNPQRTDTQVTEHEYTAIIAERGTEVLSCARLNCT